MVPKLSDDQRAQIIALLLRGKKRQETAEIFKVSISTFQKLQ